MANGKESPASDKSSAPVNASADKSAGKTTSFRVCLEVVPDFEPTAPRYQALQGLGTLSAVPMPEQGMQRVLLGPFADRQQAGAVAAKLRVEGFRQAFVVRQ